MKAINLITDKDGISYDAEKNKMINDFVQFITGSLSNRMKVNYKYVSKLMDYFNISISDVDVDLSISFANEKPDEGEKPVDFVTRVFESIELALVIS